MTHVHAHTSGGGNCGCGCGHSHAPHSEGGLRLWLPVLLSVGLLVGGLWMEYADAALFRPSAIRAAWYVTAFLPVGFPVLRAAWAALRGGDWFSEFTLMLLASIGAFCIGEYPEAVAVMLFYAVGEKLQDRAVDTAQARIRSLIDLRPDTATVVRAGQCTCHRSPCTCGRGRTEMPAAQVRPGEQIEVVAGGRVPLDGSLLSESAVFDTAALTGESLPRALRRGEAVAAGMIATERPALVRVEKPYGESTLARMLDLVREAADRKAPAELFIRRFARRYTPCVILAAAAIALLPPLFGVLTGRPVGGFAPWIYRALVFLVVSCPCALVVSIPLGYFSGIGVASRRGILFKGGNYLDVMARVNAVVFDKTGTLTRGEFSVTGCEATSAATEAGGLPELLAAVEAHSRHPLARAVTAWAAEQKVAVPAATDVEELAGLGMRAVVNGHTVLAGNARLLTQGGTAVPEDDKACAIQILCAVDGRYAGRIFLEDRPRPEAAEAVAALRREGVDHIGILSGDRTSVVARLAAALGIDRYRGDLLPEGKVEAVERLKAEKGRVVAFVGDGINDAPVLAASHAGIALGAAGADAAVETADVVIQSAGVEKVAEAMRIGRTTRRVVRLNIAFAIGIKAAVLIAGALGAVSMWGAALSDTGVALVCVAHTFAIHRLTK